MLPAYKPEAETVYTYDEWLKEYHARESRRKKKQEAERSYYIKQKLSGIALATIGIITPLLMDGDRTFLLFALPLGMYLIFTKEKVMMF